ncbi:hypothetical protein ACLOJK_020193 [Asimina triloba]
MSSCIDVASEQLCYIPCKFCNIILAVSVPCSSLFEIVTVRCGHCGNLWSVNMAAALQSLSWQEIQPPKPTHPSWEDREAKRKKQRNPSLSSPDFRIDLASSSRCNKAASRSPPQNDHEQRTVIVNPREEEIQRIKASNPEITHREAFSTAAKNVSEVILY